MTADPTSNHASLAGAADWYAEQAPPIEYRTSVTLPGPDGEPVTFYRRASPQPRHPAMCWPGVARTRQSPPRRA